MTCGRWPSGTREIPSAEPYQKRQPTFTSAAPEAAAPSAGAAGRQIRPCR
jgi:hypothetical protein